MTGNKAVAYKGPGKVELIDIDYPTFELKDGPEVNPANVGRQVRHGAILKTVATNICGSDQHMVRGRTTTPTDLVLGHEITGEVVEVGPDVEFIKVGDICSVPFNIACGRCRNCKERKTGICLNVNPDRPGSAYGYVDMGGWVGGQANFVLVPYADWNLLKFPDKDQASEKILDLANALGYLPDRIPRRGQRRRRRRIHRLHRRGGTRGLGRGDQRPPAGCRRRVVGDMNTDRLERARGFGCETVDLNKSGPAEQIEQLLGVPEVDCGVDAVGFEAKGHGAGAQEAPATVLNSLMEVTAAGGALGIPGLYVTGDPGGIDEAARKGSLSSASVRAGQSRSASPPDSVRS